MNTAAPKAPVVRLERTMDAPPSRVFQAWLDPDLLRRWMAPGFDVKRAEVDAKVGGHLRIWHALSGVDAGGFDAEILEMVPDKRLSFRWGFVGPQRREGPAYDSVLTLTFKDAPGDKTVLTLVHEKLEDLLKAMPEAGSQVGVGWEMVVDQLNDLLKQA